MTNTQLRWLNSKSVKKFTNPYEIIVVTIPSSVAFLDFINKYIYELSKEMLYFTFVILFMLLLLYRIHKNFKDYEVSIAEVLERGYFSNFFINAAKFIKDKTDNDEDVIFILRSGEKIPKKTDKIRYKVILPKSQSKLEQINDEIERITKPANLNGSWVNIKEEGDSITIYECPRTLQTLRNYLTLINKSNDYSEEQSFELHQVFNKKFEKDFNISSNSISKNIFSIDDYIK